MSNFCVNCKHRRASLLGPQCEASREPWTNHVTGVREPGFRFLCSSHRGGSDTCPDFVQKPTTWELIKGIFNVQ